MGDKFVSPCPPPTAFEREVIEILIEECAEVIQRATKLLRFGVAEIQPGQPHSNAARLGHEIGDLIEMVDLVVWTSIVPGVAIEDGRVSKRKQLLKFMQTSKP